MPWFDGSRGAVHHHAWLPEGGVQSVVVFLHGFGEHIGLYDVLARHLTAEGHAVHAFDAMGHGRSEGERGLIVFDEYVQDAMTLISITKERHPGAHLVLAGHSAGALSAYLVALRHRGICDALILSAAPLLPLDWVAERLAATGEVAGQGEPLDPTGMLSTHPDYVHALMHDPLVHNGDFPIEMLRSMTHTWAEVQHGLSKGRPSLPALVIHGELDPLVPLYIAEEVARRLPGAELVTFTGDLHDVLNEHDRDDVHRAIAGFVQRGPRAETSPG